VVVVFLQVGTSSEHQLTRNPKQRRFLVFFLPLLGAVSSVPWGLVRWLVPGWRLPQWRGHPNHRQLHQEMLGTRDPTTARHMRCLRGVREARCRSPPRHCSKCIHHASNNRAPVSQADLGTIPASWVWRSRARGLGLVAGGVRPASQPPTTSNEKPLDPACG
jgi:hypothetical protein